MFKSKKLTILLLFLNMALFALFCYCSKRFTSFKTTKSVQKLSINFDRHSADPEQSAVKEYSETDTSPYKTAVIDFKMKVYSLTRWDNVFQTANVNEGIRMELAAPSTLALLVRDRAYVLLENLQLNEWYAVHIVVDSRNSISAAINGRPVLEQRKPSLGSDIMPYAISDIAIGSGFSKTRPFDGAIRDFTFEYSLLDRTQKHQGLCRIFKFLLICSFVLLAGILIVQWTPVVSDFARHVFPAQLDRGLKIQYASLILSAGFIASVFFHYIRGMFWQAAFPLNTFLPAPATRFGDFYGTSDQWASLSFNGVGYGLSYFPSTYLLVDVLDRLGPSSRGLILSLALFCVFFMIYVYKNIRTDQMIQTIQNTIIFTFTSYPFLFTYHTANMEMFVFMFLCLFVYFYSNKNSLLCTLCLAMPLSMKLFPAVFLILFISDKRYKDVFYTLLWTILLSLIPLLLFSGGLRSGFGNYLNHLGASQKMYKDLMIMGIAGLHFGHSLLGGIRILAGDRFPPMQSVLMPYLLLTAILFGVVCLYIVFVEKEFWKKVALLVIAMNLLPYTSTDYKLMHLFIPLFLFINSRAEDALDVVYVSLLTLLLIPKDYFYFHQLPLFSLNNVLNPLFMLLIAVLIIGSKYGLVFSRQEN